MSGYVELAPTDEIPKAQHRRSPTLGDERGVAPNTNSLPFRKLAGDPRLYGLAVTTLVYRI